MTQLSCKEIQMRIMYAVVSVLLVAVGACADDSSTSGTVSSAVVSSAQPEAALVCPHICTGDVFCRLPDGTCSGACNACLCAKAGGTVDHTCGLSPGATAESDALAETTKGGDLDAGAVCPDLCQAGQICRLPDGRCSLTCNSCFCAQAGGTIDPKCGSPGAAAGEDEAPMN
jgi:hypothetical protein